MIGSPGDMMEKTKNGWRAFLHAALWCAAVAILAENVLLTLQNRKLRSLPTERVQQGQKLINLAGIGLDGRIQPLKLPSKGEPPLVIATFSPTCPFCQRTEPIWEQMSASLRARGVRMVWVSRDPVELTREYCERIGLPARSVVADPPYHTFQQLGLQFVPLTVIVGPGGVVERRWTGVLSPSEAKQILALLPGQSTPYEADIRSTKVAHASVAKFQP